MFLWREQWKEFGRVIIVNLEFQARCLWMDGNVMPCAVVGGREALVNTINRNVVCRVASNLVCEAKPIRLLNTVVIAPNHKHSINTVELYSIKGLARINSKGCDFCRTEVLYSPPLSRSKFSIHTAPLWPT